MKPVSLNEFHPAIRFAMFGSCLRTGATHKEDSKEIQNLLNHLI
jgi:hypothetical protein